MKSKAQSNAAKGWLTPEETENVLRLVEELGERGFPPDHRTIKEFVDAILQVKLGDQFPNGGVGKKWTHRFLEKHSDRVQGYYSTGLESKRGRAVNLNTHEAWFKVLGDTLKKYNVDPDCIYGCDETGFMPGRGTRTRVFGKAGKKVQHKQESGKREMNTALVTICADGSTIPPLIIFKSKAYLMQWLQDNPLNCSSVMIQNTKSL